MLYNTWAIDIETRGSNSPKVEEYFLNAKVKVPSNYKDQVKIDAYIEANRDKERRKAALHWATGSVFSVALTNVQTEQSYVLCSTDEKEVLQFLTNKLSEQQVASLVGKNSETFDFPFLVGRFMANDMSIHTIFKAGRYEKKLNDIDNIFGYSSASQQRGKLNMYAMGLGLDGKNGDGSAVPQKYNDMVLAEVGGDDETVAQIKKEVEEYNVNDTLITARIWAAYNK